MSKPSVIVSCPIDTYSGYGARSRDFVRALIEIDKYDVKILPQRWGNTRKGYLKDHDDDLFSPLFIPTVDYQPDIWVQITVPNEFQKVGKYNIGVTAGIETTMCDGTWLQGCNRMDLILVSSKHAKEVFQATTFDVQNKQTGQKEGQLKLESKVEVLFEGADLSKYFKTETSKINLSAIPEQFCYLTVGHWMQGDFGHDRKNIGYTVKSFLESFKNKQNQPALILKTLMVGSSIMDREALLDRIDSIRKTVKGKLPNIYLLHGEISDREMNWLYNHPKVKVMVSHTKGEGFGRPLLEFSLVGKPIIASGWSGHLDFLDREKTILLGGKLEQVHPSAATKAVILPEASWFTPDDNNVNQSFRTTFKHYKKLLANARDQRTISKNNFSFGKMRELLDKLLEENLPEFPSEIKLTLPKLELPKLEKVT